MFRTKIINDFYQANHFKWFYKNLHELKFQDARNVLISIENEANQLTSQDELVLNDMFLLKQILSFHFSLLSMWEEIYNTKYSNSWNHLQTCFDILRNINKFSLNNQKNKRIEFF